MGSEYAEISVKSIVAGANVRMGDPDVDELAASIKEKGLLQPIIVKKRHERYELIAGFRRLAACKNLGWREIPVLIWHDQSKDIISLRLIENIQRTQLNHLEIAHSLKHMMRNQELNMAEISRHLGKSYPWVKMHIDYGLVFQKLKKLGADPEVIPKVPFNVVVQLKDFPDKQMLELFSKACDGDSSRRLKVADIMKLGRHLRVALGRPNAGPRKSKKPGTVKKGKYRGEEDAFSIIKKKCELKLLFVAPQKCNEIAALLEQHGGEVI